MHDNSGKRKVNIFDIHKNKSILNTNGGTMEKRKPGRPRESKIRLKEDSPIQGAPEGGRGDMGTREKNDGRTLPYFVSVSYSLKDLVDPRDIKRKEPAHA